MDRNPRLLWPAIAIGVVCWAILYFAEMVCFYPGYRVAALLASSPCIGIGQAASLSFVARRRRIVTGVVVGTASGLVVEVVVPWVVVIFLFPGIL